MTTKKQIETEETEVSTERFEVWAEGKLWEEFGNRGEDARALAVRLRNKGFHAYAKTLRY